MLEVYIGPNGYGKTKRLESIKQNLITSGVNSNEILFLESELLLMDEVKDTKDSTKTMEYILTELLSTQAIETARQCFESAIDSEIINNIPRMNTILDGILSLNGQTRNQNRNFIDVKPTKEYKKLVTINSDDIKNKMGSGQRMQLILELVKSSTKNYIFIDEPEKYSHPSMLNQTAKLIEDLAQNKNVYIATHSPKLLSMMDIDLDKIYVINDITHQPKSLNIAGIIADLQQVNISNFPNKCKSYYDENHLKLNIKELHYREFLEALFAKKVYLCEGTNDELFIKKLLQAKDLYYEDHVIFKTYGKYHMLVFAKIFENINSDIHIFFDSDSDTNTSDVIINPLLLNFNHYKFINNLEEELSYAGRKDDTVKFIEFLDSFNFNSRNFL